jgi:hypothetical protein
MPDQQSATPASDDKSGQADTHGDPTSHPEPSTQDRLDALRTWLGNKLTESGASARGISKRIYPTDPDRVASFIRGERKQPPSADELRKIIYILREEHHVDVTLVEALELGFGVTREELDQELRTLSFYEGVEHSGTRRLNHHDRLLLQDIVTAMLARYPDEGADRDNRGAAGGAQEDGGDVSDHSA